MLMIMFDLGNNNKNESSNKNDVPATFLFRIEGIKTDLAGVICMYHIEVGLVGCCTILKPLLKEDKDKRTYPLHSAYRAIFVYRESMANTLFTLELERPNPVLM